MHTTHPDTPESPLILEVFRNKSELHKILWITSIWVALSIGQAIYDHILLLSEGVVISSGEFWTDLLINAVATAFAGLIGGAILVAYLQRWVRNHPYGQAIAYVLTAFTLIIGFVTIIAFITKATITGAEDVVKKDLFYQIGNHIRSIGFAKDFFLWLVIVFGSIDAEEDHRLKDLVRCHRIQRQAIRSSFDQEGTFIFSFEGA